MHRIVLVTLLLVSMPAFSQARTQRCVVGALTKETVGNYPVIILGKVIERESSDEMGDSFALTDWGKNIVHVARSWKGPNKGQRIAVHRNERWGHGLNEDRDYLIFAQREDDDNPESPLIAPVCSHTKPLSEAERLVQGLEKYFSRNHKKRR